jgi:hypothetical protein
MEVISIHSSYQINDPITTFCNFLSYGNKLALVYHNGYGHSPRTGRSGVWTLVPAKGFLFSTPVQTDPGAHPAFYCVGPLFLSPELNSQGVALYTRDYLASRLRMSGASPLLPLCVCIVHGMLRGGIYILPLFYVWKEIRLLWPLCLSYKGYTQNNGAVSMVNKGKQHHSFVYTLYLCFFTLRLLSELTAYHKNRYKTCAIGNNVSLFIYYAPY